MTNEEKVTPEQYKARLLKQNFASRCADYEDAIASLQTQVAMLQQQVEQLQGQQPVEVPESPSNELTPPPPPTVPEE